MTPDRVGLHPRKCLRDNGQRQTMETRNVELPWPIAAAGSMPSALISGEYLSETFLKHAPKVWDCSPHSIRKGLKVLAKKLGVPPHGSKAAELTQVQRDSQSLKHLFDNPKFRQKINLLEVGVESTGTAGRPRKGFWSPIKQDLARALWDLNFRYSTDENIKLFAKWIHEHAKQKEGYPRGEYLDAQILKNAVSAGQCPIDKESVDFGRAILLHAALLNPEECVALLKETAGLGNKHLEEVLAAAAAISRNESKIIQTNGGGESALSLADRWPRIQPQPDAFEASAPKRAHPELDSALKLITKAQRELATSRPEAQEVFQEGVEKFLGLTEKQRDNAVAALQLAWSSTRKLQNAEKALFNHIDRSLDAVRKKLAVEIQVPESNLDAERLVEQTKNLLDCSEHFDAGEQKYQSLISNSPKPLAQEALKQFPIIAKQIAFERQSKIAFVEESRKFLGSTSSRERIISWLGELSSLELSAVAEAAGKEQCYLTAATIVRHGLDQHGSMFAPYLGTILQENLHKEIRRKILRFCDPSTALLDGYPELRRVMIVERLRDVFAFGPIASLADPSIGTSDRKLVGGHAADLLHCIANHLDIVDSGQRVAEYASPRSRRTDETMSFLEFLKLDEKAAGSAGRVREYIRRNWLEKSADGDVVDLNVARALLSEIQDLNARAKIISSACRSVLGRAELDVPARLQINKYLEVAKDLISSVVTSEEKGTDRRVLEFQRELKAIQTHLAHHGSFGSQEWLEAELRSILEATDERVAAHTLCGDHEQLTARVWRKADSSWALEEIAMPEFFQRQPITTLQIAAESLRWFSQQRRLPLTELVDLLLGSNQFRGALEAVSALSSEAEAGIILKRKIEAAAAPSLAEVRRRLAQLKKAYGDEAVASAASLRQVTSSLSSYDVDEAEHQTDLLEVELSKRQAGKLRLRLTSKKEKRLSTSLNYCFHLE